MKRVISFILKLGVTVGLFTLLFKPELYGLSADIFGGVKPKDMIDELRGAGFGNVVMWLSFALVVKLLSILCGVVRWRLLLRGQGLKIPTRYILESWFVGRMFGIFLPGTVGLDGYRLYDSSRYTGEVIKCTTVIIVEKLTGFVALTGLVFLTFPLGMQVLQIKIPMLMVIMAILGTFVLVFFLLLFNPRVIQVLVAVLPTPGFIRNPLNKLGAAATAYSGSRLDLILAVFFGFLSHTGTSIMFFGTAMAIQAENVDLAKILFASPLVIYGTVLGPSIGGEGIREFGFLGLLATGAGVTAAAAVTLAHLGWWVGEVVPFLIGLVVFVWRRRPGKQELEAHVAAARREAAAAQAAALQALHFSPEAVRDYRRNVFGMLTCGVFAGLYVGALLGVAESAWLLRLFPTMEDTGMFWWGAIAYSGLFACAGLGIAGALLFLCLLLDKFPKWPVTFGIVFGSALGGGALVLGIWRYYRDVLAGHFPGKTQLLFAGQLSMGVVLEGFLVAALAAVIVAWVLRHRAVLLFFAGILIYGGLIGGAFGLARMTQPPAKAAPPFQITAGVSGPNIIFIGLDALRADILRLYGDRASYDRMADLGSAPAPQNAGKEPLDGVNSGSLAAAPAAPAIHEQPLDPYRAPSVSTPALEAFAKDAVVFDNGFAQASWTKPSFATIFTGLYPEGHKMTDKDGILSEDIETFVERLHAAGYYTQGYPNNPHLHALYNFDQGYVGYDYLAPVRIYGAPASATNLTVYEILRRMVKPKVDGLLRRKMDVHEFYQPAETVTQTALDWMASGRVPKDTPFFLYLHYMDPHDPFMDPAAPRGGYARATMDKPAPALDKAMETAYTKEVQHLDEYLGRLFDGLKEKGVYDSTMIVIVGDHGEEFCDHGGWWHGQTLYDELIHVPMLIKLPGNVQGGTRNPYIARHIDLAPTMLQAAGLAKAPAMPGQPLFDAQGQFANANIEASFAHNDFESNVLESVRTLDMKLIRTEEGPKYYRGLPPGELYDVTANPGERWDQNLFNTPDNAAQKSALEAVLKGHVQGTAAAAAAPQAPVSTEDIQAPSSEAAGQLDALGYLN